MSYQTHLLTELTKSITPFLSSRHASPLSRPVPPSVIHHPPSAVPYHHGYASDRILRYWESNYSTRPALFDHNEDEREGTRQLQFETRLAQPQVSYLDTRQMNVALTHARSSLFILGNVPTLERSDENWRQIVQDAHSHQRMADVSRGIPHIA